LQIHFTPTSLERIKLSRIGPHFAQNTLQRNQALQLGPWPWEVAGSPGFRRRSRPGNGGKSCACSPRVWAEPELGRGARRRGGSAAVAATARPWRRRRLGLDNKRPWEVLWVLGDRLERSAGGESERRCKFTGSGGNGWQGARWRAEREKDDG
jgi:hypothetical protein